MAASRKGKGASAVWGLQGSPPLSDAGAGSGKSYFVARSDRLIVIASQPFPCPLKGKQQGSSCWGAATPQFENTPALYLPLVGVRWARAGADADADSVAPKSFFLPFCEGGTFKLSGHWDAGDNLHAKCTVFLAAPGFLRTQQTWRLNYGLGLLQVPAVKILHCWDLFCCPYYTSCLLYLKQCSGAGKIKLTVR